MKDIGIYIHIPFCMHKCYYCDFISFAGKENLIEQYINTLKKEIENEEKLKEYNIKTIYIGGGTPSYINEKYIKEIVELINSKYNVDKTTEITIEVNPGTVTKEKLQTYYNSHINRLSIGLQSTNNKLLKEIGRIHNYEEFLETYYLARDIGFKNINIDLMLGLPNQELKDIEKSLDEVINLKPEHISVYSLILEEETKLEEKVNNKELELPDETLERKMYWLVKEKLERSGYIHYEISNFAKKGFESKHNLDCWNQKEYIGFGLAAHSYLNNIRYSNAENFKEYFESSLNKKIIHETQTKEEKQKEFMLLGLRKIDGIKISEFKNKFVENPIYLYRESLNKLVNKKLIEIDQDDIKLTKKGIDLANIVWEEFI